ncbi:MAG: HAMP domain-containing protein [Caulobacteraceae bacterium]|nr:HAMP domain-containing protein [Caulobacteraceae bacterium]
MSLRIRIVVAIVLALVLGSGLGLALAGWHARQWLRGELVSAQASADLAVRRDFEGLSRSAAPARDLADLVGTFDGDRHLQALLIGPGGRILAASIPEPASAPPAWFAALLRQKIAPARLPSPAAGVAVELRPVDANDMAVVWSEFLDLALALPLACLAGAGLVWLVVGRALRPLAAVGAVLPRIGAGDYDARAPERGPPELVRLGRGVNEMAGRLSAMRARNQALEEQILTLQDEERADIARDLHDEIGPHLFAANIDAAMAESLIAGGRTEAALDQVRSVQGAIGHIQRLVRDILARLRPTTLAELGLAAAVRDLVQFWRARHPEIAFSVRLCADGGLPQGAEEAAYRLAQESLSNAVRHGAPSAISLTLERTHEALRIEVVDDGVGAAPRGAGFGLKGMGERVAAAGGELAAGPCDDGGWRVSATLPLGRRDRAA